jgi:FkbM family methyltransferase
MYAEPCFAQEGEEMLLKVELDFDDGYYVDVGAYHPRRFSNTAYMHSRGWRGINVDANPDAIALFEKERPDDVNVCVGVGDTEGEFEFHRFNEPGLNTFDAERAAMIDAENDEYDLLEVVPVKVRRLQDILGENLPADQVVDLMSLDVEGRDLEALRSNDWERFRPRYLMVEVFERDVSALPGDPIFEFVAAQGYVCIGKTPRTAVFEDAR